MTLTPTERAAVIQQQVLRRGPSQPPPQPHTLRRFTVWSGSSIGRQHRTIEDLAVATYALLPPGVWDEVELLLKAGEGGTWQSAFDSHPLAPRNATHLLSHVQTAASFGLRISPYVVVRARASWLAGEQGMIQECVRVANRCNLNVEPGSPYYNGPKDPNYVRSYLYGCGVPASTLEVTLIPRQTQVNELGGPPCIQAWTDPTLVGSASWECYDASAGIPGPTSLIPSEAIPRLDLWGVPSDPQYRICVLQRSRIRVWADTPWCAQGLQVWSLDTD